MKKFLYLVVALVVCLPGYCEETFEDLISKYEKFNNKNLQLKKDIAEIENKIENDELKSFPGRTAYIKKLREKLEKLKSEQKNKEDELKNIKSQITSKKVYLTKIEIKNIVGWDWGNPRDNTKKDGGQGRPDIRLLHGERILHDFPSNEKEVDKTFLPGVCLADDGIMLYNRNPPLIPNDYMGYIRTWSIERVIEEKEKNSCIIKNNQVLWPAEKTVFFTKHVFKYYTPDDKPDCHYEYRLTLEIK